MVKNQPSNAGDVGSIPGRGTKIPHAAGQLSPRATNYRAHACSGALVLQLERENPHVTTREKPTPQRKILHASVKTPVKAYHN